MKIPEEMAEEYADNSDERRGHFPWRQVKDSYLAGYQAAKDQFADTGKVMPEWISVKERLPEYDHFVLLWHPDFKRQFVGCRVDSGIIDPLYWWQLELDMHEPDRIITHWMPLPEAPKGEG